MIKIEQRSIERWGIFEIELHSGESFDNPFRDVNIEAYFQIGTTIKKVCGFYDGDSIWRIRFMPEKTGTYKFTIVSDNVKFNGLEGSFESVPSADSNHGPVKVSYKHHFSYADGTPFFVMGTTVYAWTYRPAEVRKQTLESLQKYGFNKVRMFVFPKYIGNMDAIDLSYEPPVYPYEGDRNNFDFYRLNPDYFRNYEERVLELLELGIEADVILFHMYDGGMWDLDKLDDEQALFYLKYIIARLGAFKNIWWSLANEYNILNRSKWRDWDGIGFYLMENDPYNHLRSIHNWTFAPIYPDRDWMTHVCYQNPNTYSLMLELKRTYGKPVINDEYEYEGNLPYNWGNSSARVTIFRHWLTAMAGGYGTHGECYKKDGNKRDIFWTYGGEIVGESAPRLKFMKEILESLPYHEMEPDLTAGFDQDVYCIKKGIDIYLYLFKEDYPGKYITFGPQTGSKVSYEATTYDIWNCCIKGKPEPLGSEGPEIKSWTAVKLVRVP